MDFIDQQAGDLLVSTELIFTSGVTRIGGPTCYAQPHTHHHASWGITPGTDRTEAHIYACVAP